jgi:hypothetical protein
MGRGLRATLAVLAVGVLTIALSAAGGASARAATGGESDACAATASSPGQGHFGGVVSSVPVEARCSNTSDGHDGLPPLIWHGGPVMDTPKTGALVVTPIFWNPAGHPMTGSYKSIITQYLTDVAADSGQDTNVYSTLNEYFGSNGKISYGALAGTGFELGTPVNDTRALPADGCFLTHKDLTGIYSDGSGYDACLDDAQVAGETNTIVSARGLPVDLSHIYVLFLPKHVETCFLAGSTATLRKGFQACTINHEKSAGYCAYHTMAGNGMVYANLSFPIYRSPVGFTCGSDARVAFGAIQSPNNDADADVEISPTSHEIMEAITDPDVSTGWYDNAGFENGDECAYVYGTPLGGSAGTFFNQTINGHSYLTQEEFSNLDFFDTGLGCVQNSAAES